MATMRVEARPTRGHGEGSIFRRRTGEWIAAVTLRSGKRATRWSKSREEAKADLAELLRLRDAGAAQTGRVRLGEYLERWVTYDHGWAPATLRKHEAAVRVHLIPALGGVRLSELRPTDVERALAAEQRRLGAQSVRHLRATLRRALADAVRDGLVVRNAAALAKAPKLTAKERPILDADQARLLIDSTRGTRYGPLWAMLITTGMRISEALGLAWSDVNMGADADRPDAARDALGTRAFAGSSPAGPHITVRHALQRVAGEWQLRPPKTAKGRRTIPLTPLGREALRAQRAMQLEDRFGEKAPRRVGDVVANVGDANRSPVVAKGVLDDAQLEHDGPRAPLRPAAIVPLDDSLVFTTSTGHPIHATNLLPKLRADLAAAGLPTNIGLHSLRHSSASILLRAGLPLPTISAILGHSTIRITADIYAHVMEESKVEAAEAMQRMLG